MGVLGMLMCGGSVGWLCVWDAFMSSIFLAFEMSPSEDFLFRLEAVGVGLMSLWGVPDVGWPAVTGLADLSKTKMEKLYKQPSMQFNQPT